MKKQGMWNLKIILLYVGIVIMTGCGGGQKNPGSILPGNCRLRAGDIVFRRGGGFTSHAVLIADPEGEYSHVGIVAYSAGRMMIVHAVPGEPDFEGDPDRVKMERPERFFSNMNACCGCVCRVDDKNVAARVAQEAMAVYRRHTLFDHDYDRKDTTRMYCTELVTFAFAKAGCKIVSDNCGHNINMPGLHAYCLLPSDLFKSKFLKPIKYFQ